MGDDSDSDFDIESFLSAKNDDQDPEQDNNVSGIIKEVKERVKTEKEREISEEIEKKYTWNSTRAETINILSEKYGSRAKAIDFFLEIKVFLIEHFQNIVKSKTKRKERIDACIKNFYLNYVRGKLGIETVELNDEDFLNKEKPLKYETKPATKSTVQEVCTNCGSKELLFNEIMQTGVCTNTNCGATFKTIPETLTYAQQQDMSWTGNKKPKGKFFNRRINDPETIIWDLKTKMNNYMENKTFNKEGIIGAFDRIVVKEINIEYKPKEVNRKIVEIFINFDPVYFLDIGNLAVILKEFKTDKKYDAVHFLNMSNKLSLQHYNMIPESIIEDGENKIWQSSDIRRFKIIKSVLLENRENLPRGWELKDGIHFSREQLATLMWIIGSKPLTKDYASSIFNITVKDMGGLRNSLTGCKNLRHEINKTLSDEGLTHIPAK